MDYPGQAPRSEFELGLAGHTERGFVEIGGERHLPCLWHPARSRLKAYKPICGQHIRRLEPYAHN